MTMKLTNSTWPLICSLNRAWVVSLSSRSRAKLWSRFPHGTATTFPREQDTKMAKDLTWDDAEDIGIELADKFPDQDPLEVRFTDLHRYVIELPKFVDDAKKSTEGKLEAIQMAWHEEFQDRQD